MARSLNADLTIDRLRRLRGVILYRGVRLDVVWPQLLAVAVIGALFFGLAILCFRAVVTRPSSEIRVARRCAVPLSVQFEIGSSVGRLI